MLVPPAPAHAGVTNPYGVAVKRGYLLPSDADPDNAEINGYPIDLLYENLGKLEAAKTVRVYLDACFSGDSDRGMLVRAASPVFVQAALPEAAGDKLTVLAAASGDEVASWDERAKHEGCSPIICSTPCTARETRTALRLRTAPALNEPLRAPEFSTPYVLIPLLLSRGDGRFDSNA